MEVTPLLLVSLCVAYTYARGAGRAFPVQSENYAIDSFQKINRYLEWDDSNYLIDLAGNYANCKYVGINGALTVDKTTPDGGSIGGVVDDTYGNEAHVDAINSYIREVIDRWTLDAGSEAYQQIANSEKVGCSARPMCPGGRVVITCLFSPEYTGGNNIPPNIEEGGQDALAFTKDQYAVAEAVTGGAWDSDHMLENLSGFETKCSMLFLKTWSWPYATVEASKRGMSITGLYGSAPNRGETEPAMVEVLQNMKQVDSKKVGCSIIPDCMVGQGADAEMWVVVGCIFQI